MGTREKTTNKNGSRHDASGCERDGCRCQSTACMERFEVELEKGGQMFEGNNHDDHATVVGTQ